LEHERQDIAGYKDLSIAHRLKSRQAHTVRVYPDQQ
jgi:hypothetical protein